MLVVDVLVLHWVLNRDSTVTYAPTTATVALIKPLFIVSAIGTIACTSAVTSMGQRYVDSPKQLRILGVVVAGLVVGDIWLRFLAYSPMKSGNTLAIFYLDMLLNGAWAIVLAVLCFRVAKAMKNNPPATMPAAIAIKRHSDP